jgi:hypothetical protein
MSLSDLPNPDMRAATFQTWRAAWSVRQDEIEDQSVAAGGGRGRRPPGARGAQWPVASGLLASRAHLTKKQPFGCHHDGMQENRRRSSPPLPPRWVDPARVDDRLPPWLLCVCPILRDSPLGPWLVSETGPSAP